MPTTTTTTIAPCTYNAITLQAGQSFVIPPGGEIIGASDVNLIIAEDNCADLTNLEETECYGVIIAETTVGGGGSTAYDEVFVNGIIVNEIVYTFSSSVNLPLFTNPGAVPTSFITDLTTKLSELSIGGLFFNFSGWGQRTPNAGDGSNTAMICFTTFPSIATNMRFFGVGYSYSAPPGIPTAIQFPVLPSADIVAVASVVADFSGKCLCDLV